MKKFLLIVCLVLLMVYFNGCGKAPESGETSKQPSTEENTAGEQIQAEDEDTMSTMEDSSAAESADQDVEEEAPSPAPGETE